ncbi:MAG: D-alanine--D-alanine ligase [Opitutales bacterium]|nr:D-alanine--D-alanine ligase [Opitutales bacterium]
MNKPSITVVYGGVGPEREVSRVSGREVFEALRNELGDQVSVLEIDSESFPESLRPEKGIVFPVLHGDFGEDGAFQSMLEERHFIFCGTGSEGCQTCIDKAESKRIVSSLGYPIVGGLVFNSREEIDSAQVVETLGDHLVVKPVGKGSSVGLQFVEGAENLAQISKDLDKDLSPWLIERRVSGREFSIGVLNGKAMGVVEIIVPEDSHYDYQQKYHSDSTEYVCPAKVSSEETEEVQRRALHIFEACGCQDFARIDFMRCSDLKEWCFLEVNTHPGMTPSSLLPKSASVHGFDFASLVVEMCQPALKRFGNKQV